MSKLIKNERTGRYDEYPPYKCKLCGMGDIKITYDICEFCGQEDDDIQQDEPDYVVGANVMSFNQYKKFWEENKEEVLANLKNNRFYAIEKSQEYYKKCYKELNGKIREEDLQVHFLFFCDKILENLRKEKPLKVPILKGFQGFGLWS